MVYVVLAEGLADTLAEFALLKPVAGNHVYVFAPDTLNTVALPAQIVPLFVERTGKGFTTTLAAEVSLHPATLSPTTWYTIETVGLAVTVPPLLLLNAVGGDHV